MNWIQENKFIAGIGGITLVLAGAIFYFGNSQGSQYEEKLSEYEDLKSKHNQLLKAKPFPDQNNLETKKANVASYETAIDDVKNTFIGFSVGELPNISPEEFSNQRVQMEKRLRDAFNQAGTTLPQQTGFGFDKYIAGSVKPDAAKILRFQMGALDWLLMELAKSKPAELNNIRRAELSIETGQVSPPAQARNRNRKSNRKRAEAELEKAYTLMPVELAFIATESSIRDFLKSMVNSKNYFYSIRALRIRNEKQIPPNEKDAGFLAGETAPAAGPVGGDPFPGIAFPDEDEEEGDQPQPQPTVPAGERILEQVLGDEKLHVFMRFDIVFIKKPNNE